MLTYCPPWCERDHTDELRNLDLTDCLVHSTTKVSVAGVNVSIQSADDDPPEVFVWGEGDMTAGQADCWRRQSSRPQISSMRSGAEDDRMSQSPDGIVIKHGKLQRSLKWP